VAILDEAQAVKNPASGAAKLIRGLTARARLALTGTPMENSLEDLWALYDWLIPGLLGDRKSFAQRFRTPIEREGDAGAQAALNARIRPFLLRRTKAEVATELPDRTEITDLVPLGERQRALYETIRLAMDRRVQDAIAARGLAASRITILDALLKLRQVCCDPALLKDDAAAKVGSAKRARLMELLDELVAEGRRVLVFSQFVAMLRLIEADVKARGWDYAWLTGETKDRAQVVEQFQSGDAPVFLISLKAGGVGLNLTAADTVILYDPWWNPAVERQAMDRAHRIGQRRAVFVYRLVAEGSVEQAIATLQAKKQAMADALLDDGATGPLDLGAEDLAALLGPLAS
jgi:SNF2 family DNA or RNA helicase